jgi:hypothetical protein
MPYRDPTRRRAYDAAYKRRRRAHGWTKKRIDKRLTPAQIKDAEDLRSLFNEVLVEVQDADDSSLKLEAKLRIKLRAIEIGLRVFEITNHEQRIVALEEEPK